MWPGGEITLPRVAGVRVAAAEFTTWEEPHEDHTHTRYSTSLGDLQARSAKAATVTVDLTGDGGELTDALRTAGVPADHLDDAAGMLADALTGPVNAAVRRWERETAWGFGGSSGSSGGGMLPDLDDGVGVATGNSYHNLNFVPLRWPRQLANGFAVLLGAALLAVIVSGRDLRPRWLGGTGGDTTVATP